MRITAILIFLVSLSFANAMIGSLGLFDTHPEFYDSQFIESINETVMDQSYGGASVSGANQQFGVGDFIAGLFLFVEIFFTGLFLPYRILVGFGLSTTVSLMFTFPIYLVYIIAIIQFLSGRYLE